MIIPIVKRIFEMRAEGRIPIARKRWADSVDENGALMFENATDGSR